MISGVMATFLRFIFEETIGQIIGHIRTLNVKELNGERKVSNMKAIKIRFQIK